MTGEITEAPDLFTSVLDMNNDYGSRIIEFHHLITFIKASITRRTVYLSHSTFPKPSIGSGIKVFYIN